MSLVSRRFHKLVTTPPAWRTAFARFFPGAEGLEAAPVVPSVEVERSQRRSFTRLSALASWRSEYILRTRLLRSLSRGRPALKALVKSGASRHPAHPSAAAVVTYGSALSYPVSHIHATFGVGLNKKQPLFMHGAVEQGLVSTSDPALGKVGHWGLTDFEAFKHFADVFVGEAEYGLGTGNVVGMPSVMDVSQPYGRVYGEACPGGRLFYTSANEQRGRFLPISSSADHASGIPEVTMIGCAVCSVWIAKSEHVLRVTNGLFGCLAGFSNGVLSAYALGVSPVGDRRFERGEPTAKWVLSPGVPIVGICIDELVSTRRLRAGRVWAVAVNALGEIFYTTEAPTRPDFKGKASPAELDRLAWQTGRSIEWKLIESTRRSAKLDPYSSAAVDGSYTPRSSCDSHGLSTQQIVAETVEIEKYLPYKPKHFRSVCDGWDMRRQVIVDFAGDDHHGAGEAIFLISRGLEDGNLASIRRMTRCKTKIAHDYSLDTWPPIQQPLQGHSIFGGSSALAGEDLGYRSPLSVPRSRSSSTEDLSSTKFDVDWHLSNFSFGDLRSVQVSAVATDDSDFATLTVNEDPLLGMSAGSNTSSPVASPLGQATPLTKASDIPGHRARLFAIGTTSGVVMLWNMRAGLSPAPDVINTVQPVRVIYTKSPQISSLALTALCVVHGGNDGLVQAWDPLASTEEPIRTLNSRFSDRARRRIAQAEASDQGVGNNYYAAGAIVLDPDSTVLRGMVSLGSHLRYWSYSSTAADAYKSRKRNQLRRRSERGSNAGPAEQKVSATGRGLLKDYIVTEKIELEREKIARRKEEERMSGRFGTDLLGAGASEDEIMAYATMLSEEAWNSDELKRRASEDSSTVASPRARSSRPHTSEPKTKVDEDLEEAIRLSLLESEQASSPITSDFDIPIRYAKGSRHGTPSKIPRASASKVAVSNSEADDLEFAMQLSLAEEKSRMEDEESFPALTKSASSGSDAGGKGKGKSRRR